jgi:hypothetical protein
MILTTPWRRLLGTALLLSLGATLGAPAAQAEDQTLAGPELTLSDQFVTIQGRCYESTLYPEFKAYLFAPGAKEGTITYEVRQGAYDTTVTHPVSGALVSDGFAAAGDDEFIATFTAYQMGLFEIEVTVGGEIARAQIEVQMVTPSCVPRIHLSAEAADAGPVAVGDKALVVVTAVSDAGWPAEYAQQWISTSAPEGVSVSFAAETDPGVLEYMVEAAEPGTYDVTFSSHGYPNESVTVQVTFNDGSGGGTGGLAELFEKILKLIFQLIADLLALLGGGPA